MELSSSIVIIMAVRMKSVCNKVAIVSYTYIHSLCTFSADFFNYKYYITEKSSTEHSNMIVIAKFRLI